MKNIIVGTSGHIDHGKSTLIKALTGRETDQLQEEQERGISINLGFTYFDLPNGDRVGIIDVPGHERFIKNMLSGAAGIDLILMVVAADEGMMPQTIEHLDILEYMNIQEGIVVLTKVDSVEEDLLELVEMDVEDQLQGSFLENAPIVKVDSITKKGLDELVETIQEASEKVTPKDGTLPPRIHVDRVFSIKGHGTIITGTLTEGTIEKDTKLMLYPREKEANVRSIQVHDEEVEKAYAGQRTAINISNLSVDDIHRGDILAAPHSLEESMMIDVLLEMSPHTDFLLEHWDRLRLFHGAREIFCRAVPLETETMSKGESGFVQLRLEETIYCKKGDPFVVRTYSPMRTIGGGKIIDTSSRKHNLHDEDTLETLKIKEKGELKDIIYAYLRQNSSFYPDIEEIMAHTGETKEEVENNLEKLLEEEDVFKIRNSFITREYFKEVQEKIHQILEKYHKENPLSPGLSREQLKSQTEKPLPTRDFNILLKEMEEKKDLQLTTTLASLPDHEVVLNDEQEKMKDTILDEIKEAGFTLLSREDFSSTEEEKHLISYLLQNDLILIENNLISRELFEEATEKVRDFITENGGLTLAEFRDLTNSSRRNALLILDELDRRNITKRIDDKRILV